MVALILGILVFLGGELSLLGWLLDKPALMDWTGRGIVIKPNTAAALSLLGLSIAVNQMTSKGRWVVRFAAGLAALIGALTVFQYVTGLNLGIDTLLFHEAPGALATTAPGRMGPPAANSLLILGSAVALLTGSARQRLWAVRLSLIATIIALLSVAGYLYGATAMFAVATVTGIAFQTAIMLLALGLATILSVTERDPTRTLTEDSVTGLLALRLIPFVLVVPLVLGKLRLVGEQFQLYDTAFGTAIRSVVEVILFCLFGLFTFRSVRDNEAARQAAEAALAAEQARTRQATLESEARLQALLTQLPMGVGLTDRTGRCLVQSDMFARFVDDSIPSQDKSQQGRWKGWWPDGRPVEPHEWPGAKALLGIPDTVGNDFLFTDSQGNEIWTKVTATPFLDSAGNVLGAISMIQDIDSLKRAELALRQSETLFRTLGEAMPDLLWMSDAKGEPVYENPAWMSYTGLSHDALIDRGWQDINHPDDAQMFAEAWGSAMRSERGFALEARARRHDGVYRWFVFRTVPIRDDSDQVVKWLGTATDVHDRRMAEQELQLSDRRKDVFLAMLAHELRNPLAPIANSIELLKLSPLSEERAGLPLKTMERQLSQLTRLVDDLMDIGRINNDKLELRRDYVSLNSILEGSIEASLPMAQAGQVSITTDFKAPDLMMHVDEARLTQVLGNLLHNSCKFTPPGGSVTLSTALENRQLVIRVKDNGDGIEPHLLETVFDMFTQVSGNAVSKGGLGIGLTLVKRLVEMHGGTIEASSDGTGRGSEFTIRMELPVEVARKAAVVEPAKESTSPLRILVVDDNVDAATSLALLLALDGHDTRTVHDGRSALKEGAAFEPHVVLMDIGLPEMSGLEACAQMRIEPWGKDIMIVAISGWGQREDIERSISAGFDQHLVKPVETSRIRELLATVRPFERSDIA